ncbi:uncharacterized protein LOC144044851 [Vanacampus margaritifer]
MQFNHTCVLVNGTACAAPNSPVGLAVGLTLFFLTLAAVAVTIAVKFYKNKWNLPLLGQRKSQKKDSVVTTQFDHQYASMVRTQSSENAPIYENLARQKSGAGSKSRPSCAPTEDLYLQCDSPDDAIYSNDPACNLAILPESRDDDVYIVPDS